MTTAVVRTSAAVAAVAVLAAAVVFVVLVGFRPSYDAYGWLVWGHQALYGSLDTGSAPSWKPLTFLFTLPYALAHQDAVGLWMVTSTAAAFAAPVFAGRIAYRLTGPAPGRRYAPIAAALFAAIGVVGLEPWWHMILIANSDPMVVALCLGAVDCHLSKRPRLAFVLLVLASLGRPETWAFGLLYAVWAWRAVPSMRVMLVAGILIVPAGWFVIPGLTSRSWFIAGDLALKFKFAIHGNKLAGVWLRFLGLVPTVIQVAWLAAVILFAVTRNRVALGLIGCSALWVAIEIAFAYHGWPAVPRYLMEPAAVMTALAGAALGQALTIPTDAPTALRVAGVLCAALILVWLIPAVRDRVNTTHALIVQAQGFATEINLLHRIVVDDGGGRRIIACGRPVTSVGYQSTLAFDVGLNVGEVGHRPGRQIAEGGPIVLFKRHLHGWLVRPIHTLSLDHARCAALRADVDLG